MKTIPFRRAVPVRSTGLAKKQYRAYKEQLREDFYKKCGYCDGSDTHVGGLRGSHIDHLAPRSKFPALENSYQNLVYSCPFCNRAKSDKWIGNDPAVPNDGQKGFVDPCDPQLDQHLKRDEVGKIVYLTPLGRYLIDNLNLRLARHQFIWQLDHIEILCEKLEILMDRLPPESDTRYVLAEQIAQLFKVYRKYNRMLHDE